MGSNGAEIDLGATAGYAGTDVIAIEGTIGGERRVIPVSPDIGAYVVLGPAGPWTVRPLDAAGVVTGAARTLRLPW